MQYGELDTSYQAAGQLEGIQQLVERFYFYMDTLEEAQVIRAMHKKDLVEVRKRLSYFLSAWLGGPKLYSEHYGPIAIPRAHLPFPIDEAAKDAWLTCMEKAVAEQPYPDEFKSYLMVQFAVPANRILQAQGK
ncbi:MAG: group II truncated hemoglobin [Sinobacterium sp.]|nr:group II truncated hemoglobin [Sinobacterium sp.]